MSRFPVVKYTRIDGANKLGQIIIAHDLYLPKGQMLKKILQADRYATKSVFGYVGKVNGIAIGIGVFTPLEDPSLPEGDGMIFVNKTARGKGIAKDLVEHLIAGVDKVIAFYPWDTGSIRFYRKLFLEGILTEKNFMPYELALIKSGANFLTGKVHSQCRQAEQNYFSKGDSSC